jgi:hypothetical protein
MIQKQVKFQYRKIPPGPQLSPNINVSAGQHTLKLRFVNTTGTGYLIEWIELTNNPSLSIMHSPVQN